MLIRVTKKNLKLGQPKKYKCPLSLAFQEATGLDWWCIEAGYTGLQLNDNKGCLMHFWKYPDEIIAWNKHYWGHVLNNWPRKMPKPTTFRIGEIERWHGVDYHDILQYLSFKIEYWDLGEYELLDAISQEKEKKRQS